MALWKNLSCQDILRHYSPFWQGVCQSSTTLEDCCTHPQCLWRSNQLSASCTAVGFFILVLLIYRMSWPSLLLYSSAPVLLQPGLCDPTRCLPSLLIRMVNARAHLPGPAVVLNTPSPHCVFPLAYARTLCRLMASSKKPATFSPSSCTANRTHLRLDVKSRYNLTNDFDLKNTVGFYTDEKAL